MSTFMLKDSNLCFTPVSNVFIEKYMPQARGEFIKVYLLLLRYNTSREPGISGTVLAASLNLLESDVMNALNYWNDQGVIRLVPFDNMNNFNIEFLSLEDSVTTGSSKDVNLLDTLLNNSETTGMLKDIEKILARPLSTKEMETYLSWQRDFQFTSELILILIEYCASKGKFDYRYIEKVALSWNDMHITTINEAQQYIKQTEDKWIKIRKVLSYLGLKNTEIMKPQEELINKWLSTYKFSLELIQKAADICFERLNRADFKYIDGILSKWYKDNIKTLEDVAIKDRQFKSNYNKQNNANKTNNKNNNNTLGFNNFEPRDYDYDSLEKKLLGWDTDD